MCAHEYGVARASQDNVVRVSDASVSLPARRTTQFRPARVFGDHHRRDVVTARRTAVPLHPACAVGSREKTLTAHTVSVVLTRGIYL